MTGYLPLLLVITSLLAIGGKRIPYKHSKPFLTHKVWLQLFLEGRVLVGGGREGGICNISLSTPPSPWHPHSLPTMSISYSPPILVTFTHLRNQWDMASQTRVLLVNRVHNGQTTTFPRWIWPIIAQPGVRGSDYVELHQTFVQPPLKTMDAM